MLPKISLIIQKSENKGRLYFLFIQGLSFTQEILT